MTTKYAYPDYDCLAKREMGSSPKHAFRREFIAKYSLTELTNPEQPWFN
jgi:hypothetical protein